MPTRVCHVGVIPQVLNSSFAPVPQVIYMMLHVGVCTAHPYGRMPARYLLQAASAIRQSGHGAVPDLE